MTTTASLPPRLTGTRLFVRSEGRPWRALGPAAGPVELPGNALLRLDLPGEALEGAPAWDEPLRRAITEVRIVPGTATHEALQSLTAFPGLAALSIGGAPLDPETLARLPELPQLAHLDLSRHPLAAQDAEALSRLPALRSLSLDGAFLGTAGLAPLAKLPALRCLSLLEAQVEGPWLEALSPLGELRELRFPLAVHGNELNRLAAFPKLEVLWLRDTLLTPPPTLPLRRAVPELRLLALPSDQGVEAAWCLDGHPRLRHLLFESSHLTVDAVRTIAGLPELRTLSLGVLPDGAAVDPLRRAAALERLQLAPALLSPETFLPLADLAPLRSLQFGSPLIHDGTVGSFRVFDGLEHLHLSESSLTPNGLRNLRTLLPEVQVTHARHWLPVPEVLRGGELFARPAGRYDAEAWQRLLSTGKGMVVDAFDELSYRQAGGEAKELRALQGRLATQVVEVQLRAARIDREDALLFSSLTGLQTLDLTSSTLPEGFLTPLAKVPSLQKLVLDFTTFGDAQAPVLRRFPALVHLSARATRLTAAGLEALAGSETLATVDIQGCRVEQAEVAALGKRFPRIGWSGPS